MERQGTSWNAFRTKRRTDRSEAAVIQRLLIGRTVTGLDVR